MVIEFGAKAKDRVTGFQGSVIGRVQYITGCNQVLLAPPVGPDGAYRESQWFDDSRLLFEPNVADAPLDPAPADSTAVGPDRSAPRI